MSKRVTYGTSGLIDWNAIIHVGKARLNVHFTGGAITKYGITPAEFTTSDPITQRIIEDSEYYRSGRIRILRCTETHTSDTPDPPAATAPVAKLQNDSQLKIIWVNCMQDAVEYMHEHFGIPSVNIRTLDALNKVAAQHGIKFKFRNSK